MDVWAALWAGFLMISIALFAGLAATVGVGAWFDLRRMLGKGDEAEQTPDDSHSA